MWSTLLFTALASVFSLGVGGVAAADGECNGAQELCERPYHKVAFAMTHNSYSVGAETAANQNFDVTQQLNDGIRVLNFDAVPPTNSTGIELCHTSCELLDAGPAKDTLAKVVAWLDNNKNEVLTIIWENSQGVNAAAFQQAYTDAGLDQYAYTQDPAGKQEWPTLSALIQSGKRVINFVGAGADPSVPWLHDEFGYVFETPFENFSPDAFKCVVDRPAGDGGNLGLYVLNHFLYSDLSFGDNEIQYPNRADAATTNGKSLEQHVQTCTQTFTRIPNFVAVDFYEQGSDNVNIMSVVASLNKVQYTPKPLGNGLPSNSEENTTNNGGSNGASRHSLLAYMLGATAMLALM